MTGRIPWKAVFVGVALLAGAGALAAAEKDAPAGSESQSRRPNILLIVSDDQGWGDVRANGNARIDTPTLDYLAGAGASFDRFYVSPVCSPTRASLLTGRYHDRMGVYDTTRGKETVPADEVTIAEVLQRAGYATGCFGKWHSGLHYPHTPPGQGFDRFVGFLGGHLVNYFDPPLIRGHEPIRPEGYVTDILTDAAIRFIEDHEEKPWFCYVPYNVPHAPFQVPDAYFDKYKERGLSDSLASVYGMVENMDANIARLLSKLEERGLDENTVVLFTGDNGANTERYDGFMRGRKSSLHEGGGRVPLYVRWPGHTIPGQTVEPITAHIDLLPTLAEMAGIADPETKPLDGRSLVPLLNRDAGGWPDRMLFSHWRGVGRVGPRRGAVRTRRWRAVYTRGGEWQLFDMLADPREEHDRADREGRLVERFRKAYEKWMADVSSGGYGPVPAEVGHPEAPVVVLPGHEARLQPGRGEGIAYHLRRGWTWDYVDHWTDTGAYPRWPIKVVRPGRYRVSLRYQAAESSVGTELRVEAGDASVRGTIEQAHNPEHLPSPDRVERHEVYEHDWAELPMGVIELSGDEDQLKLKALRKPGEEVAEIKGVRLEGPLKDTP